MWPSSCKSELPNFLFFYWWWWCGGGGESVYGFLPKTGVLVCWLAVATVFGRGWSVILEWHQKTSVASEGLKSKNSTSQSACSPVFQIYFLVVHFLLNPPHGACFYFGETLGKSTDLLIISWKHELEISFPCLIFKGVPPKPSHNS